MICRTTVVKSGQTHMEVKKWDWGRPRFFLSFAVLLVPKMVQIGERYLIKWFVLWHFGVHYFICSHRNVVWPLFLSADPAIRLYIIYLSTTHNFPLQVLDDQHLMLLDPKKSTLDLIQESIDELQDRNTYQKSEDAPVSSAASSKKKRPAPTS